MAIERLACTFCDSDSALLRLSDQVGMSTISAAPHTAPIRPPSSVIQACQRSSGNVAPSEVGTVGGGTVMPFDAPRNLGNLSASEGRPTASARVAPAR